MFPLLFEPIRLGKIESKNRILMPAMGTLFSMDQKLNERHVRFYERRAEGGAGIIVAGPVGIDFIGSGAIALSLMDDSYIPDFKKLADRVHAPGSKIMVQLFHGGRYTFSFMIEGQQAIAPSAVRSRYTGEEPREMTLEDIEKVQDAFAQAARRAREAGIDGVEIIGSAGYLISQFLSPITNQRTDEYGGSFEKRARFGVETIRKVRAAVGDDYTVTIRVAGNDFVRGGNTNEESARYCRLFEEAGVDGINVTGGWHEAFVAQLTMEVPRGGYAYLAGGIRNAVNVPVISSNRITDPGTAERILAEGMADMVALGRVLVADPDWPLKSKAGRPQEIRPCVGCMQGCMDRIFTGNPLCCLVNAEAGLEEEREIHPNRVDPETAACTEHFDIMPGSADRFRSQIMDGVLTRDEARRAMFDIYAELATKHTEDYARLFRLTAEAADGPILLHCAAGKDRTGWGVALLLLSVGVSREDVLADYMVSGSRFPVEEEIRSSQREWIEKGAPPVQADALRPLYSVDAHYLQTGLDAALASAGSLETYLRDALGVGPDLRRALRARFLSDSS